MDYRHIAIDELTKFAEEHSEMTLGEILYSSLRENMLGQIPEKNSQGKVELNTMLDTKYLNRLRKIDDKQLYSAINKALKYEREQ